MGDLKRNRQLIQKLHTTSSVPWRNCTIMKSAARRLSSSARKSPISLPLAPSIERIYILPNTNLLSTSTPLHTKYLSMPTQIPLSKQLIPAQHLTVLRSKDTYLIRHNKMFLMRKRPDRFRHHCRRRPHPDN